MSDTFNLPRSGKPPLRFEGDLLAESDGRRQSGRDHNRYHQLAVYQTTGGRFVVRFAFRTSWQGELDRDTAAIVASPAAVGRAFQDYDPCAVLVGYPTGSGYEDRQARLMLDVRTRYEAQVSEILEGDEFAEDADAPADGPDSIAAKGDS